VFSVITLVGSLKTEETYEDGGGVARFMGPIILKKRFELKGL
jgi:hypothetical protein